MDSALFVLLVRVFFQRGGAETRSRICGMRIRLPIMAFFLVAVAFAQRTQPVELAQEPHYKELLKNSSVHVWLLELGPRDASQMHRHRSEHLLIQLQDTETATTRWTDPPSAPFPKQFSEGEMWYLPPVTHAVKNETPLTLRQIEVELLQRGPSRDYSRDLISDASQPKLFAPPVNPYGNYKDSGSMYNVYLTRSQLLPGASSQSHEHKAPHLVVAMFDLELKDEREGKTAISVKLNKGEVAWVEGGFKHKLTNVGSRPAQVVTVEYR